MTSQSNNISPSPLLFVDNKETMINMENNFETILKLLAVIRDLEKRITELE